LESVIAVTVAVVSGAHSDIEIANRVPGIEGTSRQGRYYRQAAEILGFVVNNRNHSSITLKGTQIAANPTLTNPLLLESVLNLHLYQKLIPYIELHPGGLNRQQIIDYLQSISEDKMGPSMIPRRISTILGWLHSLGIIEQHGDNYQISNRIISDLPVLKINDIEQPIIPTTGQLRDYEEVEARISGAKDFIMIYKNEAKLERASYSHKKLTNLVANRIKQAGGIPKSNQFIDLATRINRDYLFEMKSTTSNNFKAQIRKGISQLYEYRYLQSNPDAKLVLVIENPISGANNWIIDYLELDRMIHLIWDGDDELYATERTRNELRFLNLSTY